MNIEYRDTSPDLRKYLTLFNSTGWNTTYEAGLKELRTALDNSWCVVTAYHGNELVGIGRVVSDGILYAMIYDMIVLPSYQGGGVGTEILKKLINKCKEAGIREVQLFSAKGKAPFYGKRGFIERPKDAPGMKLE